MDEQNRNEKGKFSVEATQEDVFETVTNATPFVNTQEVAQAHDISVETARRKLTKLYEEGRINRKDAGGAFTWWVP